MTGRIIATLALPSPELYTYNVIVDGVSTIGPSNDFVQRDGARYMNALLVKGDFAELYSESGKPGNLEQLWYYSAENDMTRSLYVYTPYAYNVHDRKVKYPVLYLLHGGGGDEDAWATLGRFRSKKTYAVMLQDLTTTLHSFLT